MRLRYRHLHLVLAAAWIAGAVVLGMKTALIGNEEAVLRRRAAHDLVERTELVAQSDRLRNAIDSAASERALVERVRRLGLPLQPPPMARKE